jgi:hypothetical protein
MLKEMVLFFVLQLLKTMMLVPKLCILLFNRLLGYNTAGFQFSVFGSGFSVLVPVLKNFNSLYQALNSPYFMKSSQFIVHHS